MYDTQPLPEKWLLLAEDSQDDELWFKRTLERAGVQNPIKVVRDGSETIAYLQGEGIYSNRKICPKPAVLFLDLVMHPMGGLEVLEWIQTQSDFDNTLVVVLSGFDQSQMLRDAYARGADTFLFKPLLLPDLESLIRHFPGHWIIGESDDDSALLKTWPTER